MSRTALVVLLALCAPVRSEAGDSEADELRKARGTSAVLLKKTDTTLFTQLESQARHVDVDALGETLVAPAAGSCMADATVSRAPWCDEFKEADLRKGKQGWVKENGTQLWSMAVSDEHYTLGDYDFRKKQFALKFVPTWCDVPSGMCVTSQLSRLQAGTNALFVLGAYEMGDSRFGSSVAIAAEATQAKTIAGWRETVIPSSRGTVGDLVLLFRVTGKTRRLPVKMTNGIASMNVPFLFAEVAPVALRITRDDDVVLEHYF
jgi:hypothetical protein